MHDPLYFDLLVIFYIVTLCMMKHRIVQCESPQQRQQAQTELRLMETLHKLSSQKAFKSHNARTLHVIVKSTFNKLIHNQKRI